MKIIGHRGAAGLALENTTESIMAAIDAGVDAIEFDIRVTKDNELVLSHDRNLQRVTSQPSRWELYIERVIRKGPNIQQQRLATLKKIPLNNGQKVPTLSEAAKAAGRIPIVIEGKDNNWADPLAKFIKQHPRVAIHGVISFNHRELFIFSQLMPDIPVFAIEQTKPLDVIRAAHFFGFTGIDVNFWILNPLTYALARYYKLDIIVYAVNKPWIARFLRLLYPRISITTDVPDQLQFLRKKPRLIRKNK